MTVVPRVHRAWSLLAVIACSGGQDPSSDISADQLADAMADAFCSSIEGCCQAAGFRYDGAACRANEARGLRPQVEVRLGPGVRYDPGAAFRCVQAMRARSCSFGPSFDGPCEDIFVGLRQLGEAC